MNSSEVLPNAAAAQPLTKEQWVALHVPRFAQAAPAYLEYEAFLKAVLKELAAKVAPLAVVEVRAKRVASFAEKILRKRQAYQDPKDPLPPDPLVRMTDLCGGRVICHTAAQVRAVCQLIERAFVIDWPNSEDVSRRLRTAEFGYRSVHYIVQPDAALLRQAGLETAVPKTLLGFAPEVLGPKAGGIPLKAEIQVRTLLEHASSDLAHDTIYKSELKVPDRIQRQYAALAAVLEGADREIERLLAALGDFRSNFGAWHEKSEVEREIAHARVLLSLPETSLPAAARVSVAVRAAQLALAIGEHRQAIDVLQPFQAEPQAEVRRILGQALVESHWQTPDADEFAAGQHHLAQAAALAPGDAETLGLRAECAAHLGDDVEARRLFAKAVAADGTEPLTLMRYLEFEAGSANSESPLRMATPMIRAALARARHQIESRANLAAAWSAVAMAHLFLNEPFPALHALAQVTRLCGSCETKHGTAATHPCPCAAGRSLLRLRETVRRLRGIREKLPGFDWFERFLLLALAVRIHDKRATKELAGLASWKRSGAPSAVPHFTPARGVVILAGGCEPEVQAAVTCFGKRLRRATDKLECDLISGGTRIGISGVAGDVAAASNGQIQAFGYLPSHPPRGIKEDTERYTRLLSAPDTKDFTPLDPLQAWTDLFAAGIAAQSVRVLCYAPGDIARAECDIALTLGARVALVVDASLPKAWRFDTADWEGCPTLLLLPNDAMTFRAFLQVDQQPLSDADKDRLTSAARMAHGDYLRSATPVDASLQPWDKLSESLQLSNYYQVAYWEQTLRDYGLGVRALTPADQDRAPLVMADVLPKVGDQDPIAALAELEHGRWNVERLSFGWRYAPEKDVAKKLSPWLIPWREVPPKIQRYDLDAMAGLPKKLREAGLELYRLA
jgi:ppGpp synthetase/RelA/SpoT-type nucleotidyltranferase